MTLTELRYVVAVARERHFGRAAAACYVSQPTLSVAIRKLEDELGMTLFERSSTEIGITPGGERVVEQAQRVLEEAAAIAQIAASGKDELFGVLRIGVIYTIGPYLLPQLIRKLRDQAPKMPLQIEESFTADLSEQLKRGDLDVIILSLPYSTSGILTETLYEEPFVVLIPNGHALEREKVITPSALAREDLLLLGPGHCFRDQVLQYCPECNLASIKSDNFQRTLEGSSLETIRLMVATGMGVTVLPQTSINGFQQDLVSVRPFIEPAPKRLVAVAWRKTFPRPAAINTLAAAIRSCDLGSEVTVL